MPISHFDGTKEGHADHYLSLQHDELFAEQRGNPRHARTVRHLGHARQQHQEDWLRKFLLATSAHRFNQIGERNFDRHWDRVLATHDRDAAAPPQFIREPIPEVAPVVLEPVPAEAPQTPQAASLALPDGAPASSNLGGSVIAAGALGWAVGGPVGGVAAFVAASLGAIVGVAIGRAIKPSS